MALPTASVITKLRAVVGGEEIEFRDHWEQDDAIAVISNQVISVTNSYESLPLGEVDPDYAVLYVKHLGVDGAILLTYDTIKPSGFGYIRAGETWGPVRLPDLSSLVIEMIAMETAGPHQVQVVVFSGASA